jgi:hypothetical protein
MKSIDTHWLGNFYQKLGRSKLNQRQEGSADFGKGALGCVLRDTEDISHFGA